MSFAIRRASPADAAVLSDLVRRSFEELAAADWEPAAGTRFLADASAASLEAAIASAAYAAVALDGTRPVGFILMSGPSVLAMLFVDPACLRRGIGRGLWEAARAFVEREHPGVKTIELNSTPYALGFYVALGFAPISGEFVRSGCRATRMACWLPARALGAELLPAGAGPAPPLLRLATENPAVHLRPWTRDDYGSLVRYGNDKAVWQNLNDRFPHPYTHEDAVAWVRVAGQAAPSIFLAIDLHGEAIGGIGVIAMGGTDFHTGQFGYWLGRPHWGKGITTVSARALKDYALGGDRFERLQALVFSWNPASMRVLEKSGFVREGVLRKSVLKDGQLVDQVMYAAIKDA